MATANDRNEGFGGLDYVKINILVLATTGLWQSLHILVLPRRLLSFVSEAQKNTYLGWLTFAGLLLAMVVQPVAGAVSDRYGSRRGRRRPYILIGCIAVLLVLPGIGLAGRYITLFVAYFLLQVATNTALGPFQAFIPDLVPRNKRGLASGVKGIFEITGVMLVLLPVGFFIDRYPGSSWLAPSLGLIALVLLVNTLVTVVTVKERPALSRREVPLWKTIASTFKIDVRTHSNFMWLLASRLFTFMSLTTLQQFAFYYLADVKEVANVGLSTALLAVSAGLGILLLSPLAGLISDKVGRKPIVFLSGILGATGIAAMYFAHQFVYIIAAAGIIGVAVGLHYSTNWALATDLVPETEEARFMGLTNLATAGGAALARLIGPVIDTFNRVEFGLGYNVMLAACFVYFVIGSMLILKVKSETS